MRYLKVWWLYTINTFQMQSNVRWAFALFLFAKILRFGVFIFFLIILVSSTRVLAGYDLDQVILFFLSYNFLDILSQILFREVYRFRSAIIFGNFDLYLVKPLNPLFRALFAGTDLLDFITLIPLLFAIVYYINKLQLLSFYNLVGFALMLSIGFLIALSLHILVLAIGILTTGVDNAIFLYRDLVGMGRVPIDVYTEPIRSLITFVIPVGIMMTFPAKALLGLLSLPYIIYAAVFAIILLYLSLFVWKFALRNYSSASS